MSAAHSGTMSVIIGIWLRLKKPAAKTAKRFNAVISASPASPGAFTAGNPGRRKKRAELFVTIRLSRRSPQSRLAHGPGPHKCRMPRSRPAGQSIFCSVCSSQEALGVIRS